MKRYVAILVLAVFSAVSLESCVGSGAADDMLHDAEMLMDWYPGQALDLLESVDQSDLTTRKAEARYALLLSMALDENCIDVSSDSIIAPSVKYYENHGHADKRLKAYYYWGRIAMNAGEYEDAISRFTIAERYAEKASDKIAVGRLYKAQTSVYKFCYDTDAMIEAAGKAADLYMSVGDTVKYLASLFDVTSAYLNEVDTVDARRTLDHIREYWTIMDGRQRSQYFANRLILEGQTSPYRLAGLLEAYEGEIDSRLVQWLAVSKAYYVCGNYVKAQDALEKFDCYGGEHNDVYFWTSGLVHEASGDFVLAMHCYKKYIEQTDDKLGYLLEADIRFVKERYETRMAIYRRNWTLAVLMLCVLVMFLSITLIMTRMNYIKRERRFTVEKLKAEKDEYEGMYNAALVEISGLNETLDSSALDKTVRSLVGERLGILNKFITAYMTPNFSADAAMKLTGLMQDTEHFIESTRISFLVEHPEFIGYLKKRGLSDREIGYCCFYAMGLKGKDISAYMGNGHYKLSSVIRRKLGLSEHDTNLDIYLRRKLSETGF